MGDRQIRSPRRWASKACWIRSAGLISGRATTAPAISANNASSHLSAIISSAGVARRAGPAAVTVAQRERGRLGHVVSFLGFCRQRAIYVPAEALF